MLVAVPSCRLIGISPRTVGDTLGRTRIEVTIDDDALRKALQKLSQTVADPQPVMTSIAEG